MAAEAKGTCVIYWLMKYVVLGPIIRIFLRPQATGIEHLPREGAAIIVSNHLSFIDSILMPLYVPRPVSFLAKSDYFTGKGVKGWAPRVFMKGTGPLPLDRSGGKASEASLNTGLRVLGQGDLLAIYPEGTRSPDGRLYRGRTGIARMVLEAKCPIIPVSMVNTEKMMPIGAKWPRRVKSGIHFGEPLDFSRFEGLEGDRFVLRSITDEIMYRLQELGQQEYVDVYASSIRQAARPVARP